MDVKPLWAADRVVAPTPGPAITIPKTANEFAINGETKTWLDQLNEGSIESWDEHHRSFQYPIRIAENMLVEVGKSTFLMDFVILEMEEDIGMERMTFSIDSAMKHSYSNDDTCFIIDVVDEILEEDFDALLDEGSKILYSIEGTLLEDKIFAEFDEFMAMTIEKTLNLIPIKKKYPLKKSPLILTIK
ncbi:hypothetical protein Tco_1004560 [Tanacetum coccineum]|uniref:Reverse transcriptase domain-containing protein n=1 Tax=Tanacetum coccineum TaxID=301880 RepID=A0ABQ5FEQ5_9ASTR